MVGMEKRKKKLYQTPFSKEKPYDLHKIEFAYMAQQYILLSGNSLIPRAIPLLVKKQNEKKIIKQGFQLKCRYFNQMIYISKAF